MVTITIALTMILSSLGAMAWLNTEGKLDLPDLIIEKIEHSPQYPFKNEIITIITSISNQGDADAYDIGIALYADNRSTIPLDILIVPFLGKSENKTINFYWTPTTADDFTLFVWIDYQNKIEETSEENNWESREIHVEIEEIASFPPKQGDHAEWWDPQWHFRVPISVDMPGYEQDIYTDKMIKQSYDFTTLLKTIGVTEDATFDTNSTRIIEYRKYNGNWIPIREVPHEILFHPNYNPKTNANLTLIWIANGTNNPQSTRYYYLYWDALENGDKEGRYCEIQQGIKDGDFETKNCSIWTNSTEGLLWQIEYVTDEHNTGSRSLCISRETIIWKEGHYANVTQEFPVSEEGNAHEYWLHTAVKCNIGDLQGKIEGSIVLNGKVIWRSTQSTSGWKDILVNVTSVLQGAQQATIELRARVIGAHINLSSISMYWDTCYIETRPHAIIKTYVPEGWWATMTVDENYIGGVHRYNILKCINISSVANPWTVNIYLSNPQGEDVKISFPLPDPGFEDQGNYTLLYNSEKTANARFDSAAYQGNVSVSLNLEEYEGEWWWEDQEVRINDHAALRQSLGNGIPLSQLPDLWFWYTVQDYDPNTYVRYTLMRTGGKSQYFQIEMSDLIKDEAWHRYDIPPDIVEGWKELTGLATGLEIRLVAKANGIGETVINLDKLGCSVFPRVENGGMKRTQWTIDDFYSFGHDIPMGEWMLKAILDDAPGYEYILTTPLNITPAANLEIVKIVPSQGKTEGEQVNISVMVRNHGPDNVSSAEVSLTIYQETEKLESTKLVKDAGILNASEDKEIIFTWSAKYGNPLYGGMWIVLALIDPQNKVIEWNETNNWDSTNVIVKAAPDLQIKMSDVNFVPAHPQDNESVEMSITVHNIGYENALQNETSIQISYMYNLTGDENWTDDQILFSTNFSVLSQKEKNLETIWMPPHTGTATLKIQVNCSNERNKNNNQVFKDIKIGGIEDITPPQIGIVTVKPSVIADDEGYINITADITDGITAIDYASIEISDENDKIVQEAIMDRYGFTHIYYYNTTITQIGYYTYVIKAWDTSLFNNQASKEGEIRIVKKDIEAVPPDISQIQAYPQRQITGGYIEVSAFVTDDTGVSDVRIYIRAPGEDQYTQYPMEKENSRYYYNSSYNACGEYPYYIWAMDTTVNKNIGTSMHNQGQTFIIPQDYDNDGVPDTLEIDLGSDPKNASDAIRITVTVNEKIEDGYLILVQNRFIYWDRDDNITRETKQEDVDGDGINETLINVDGIKGYDFFYNHETQEIGPYTGETEDDEQDWRIYLILIPLAVLLGIICFLYIFLTKKRE